VRHSRRTSTYDPGVVADEPFAVEKVVAAVRRARSGARLDLPASMEQYSFVLTKETP
jgi:hypothetical protein